MAAHDPIAWTDKLVTGVAEIDEQHRVLVSTLNEAGIKLTGTPDLALLERITLDLLSYALYHFETEEALMEEYGYTAAHGADAATHCQQHRSFSSTVVTVRAGIKNGTPISRDDLLSFLNGWLIDHILSTDKKLAAHIVAQPAAIAP